LIPRPAQMQLCGSHNTQKQKTYTAKPNLQGLY